MKASERITCDEIENLKVLADIRNDPTSNNKIVQRVEYKNEIFILKTVRESEWLLEQAQKEIHFLEIFDDEENIPKLILQCPSDKHLRQVFIMILGLLPTLGRDLQTDKPKSSSSGNPTLLFYWMKFCKPI